MEERGGRFWLRRGRTVVQPDGTRRRIRVRQGPFPTRDAAERARRSAAPLTPADLERITWSTWLGRWLSNYVEELEAEERRSYGISLTRSVHLHLIPRIGHLVMTETRADDIKRLWRELLDPDDGGLSRGTLKNIRGALSLASKAAVAEGLIPSNLVAVAPLPRASLARVEELEASRMTVLTPEGVAWTAQAAIDGVFGRWSGPTLVALDTGCRRGEALGLRWTDIDFDRSMVRFLRQVIQDSGYGAPYVGLLKNRQVRRVAVPERTIRMLAERHARAGHPQEGFVFAEPDGSLPRPESWTQRWRRSFSQKHPHLATTTLHDLRHTHASLLLRDGESIVAVSERLGHSTPSFTLDQYAHTIPSDSLRVARRWERIQ